MSEENLSDTRQNKKAPFLLKAISVLIIVEGLLGFLFFFSILIYQLFNPDFLSNWGYGDYSGNFLFMLLAMYSIVHLGLALSGFYILSLHKNGIYILLLSIIILLATSYIIQGEFNWLGLIIGFIVFIYLSYFIRLFS
jgi:hypothetical protein